MTQPEFIFRGDLPQFWVVAFKHWQDLHKVYRRRPFTLTATGLDNHPSLAYTPGPEDRIFLEFSSHLPHAPTFAVVEVEAVALVHAPRVRLRVYISWAATDAHRQDALSRWSRLYNLLDAQGLVGPSSGWHLQDMPEILRVKASEPAPDDDWDEWFAWYHRARDVGLGVTLKYIAQKKNCNPDYVRQQHRLYKKRNDLTTQ